MRHTEAAGHFHLYAWLKEALQDVCVVSPEFPTGNGKVDLHLKCSGKTGIVEVKSFASRSDKKPFSDCSGHRQFLRISVPN